MTPWPQPRFEFGPLTPDRPLANLPSFLLRDQQAKTRHELLISACGVGSGVFGVEKLHSQFSKATGGLEAMQHGSGEPVEVEDVDHVDQARLGIVEQAHPFGALVAGTAYSGVNVTPDVLPAVGFDLGEAPSLLRVQAGSVDLFRCGDPEVVGGASGS